MISFKANIYIDGTALRTATFEADDVIAWAKEVGAQGYFHVPNMTYYPPHRIQLIFVYDLDSHEPE